MSHPDPSVLTRLDRREYLRGALAAAATVVLAGCAGDDGPGGDGGTNDAATPTGLLSTAVSDQPGDIHDFESCVVTLDGIWVGPRAEGSDEAGENEAGGDDADDVDDGTDREEASAESDADDAASGSQPDDEDEGAGGPPEDAGDDEQGADADEEGEDGEDDEDDGNGNGRTYYAFDEPQEADLVELQGDRSQLVGEHELEVGTYRFLQLDVAGVEGVLEDGSEADVETPGNAPLQFQEPFDVREGYRTTFVADFTPVRRGNGSYVFRPVASETEVHYEPVEDGSDGDDEQVD